MLNEQIFILAQNERVIPSVAAMLEGFEFAKLSYLSNVYGDAQRGYSLMDWLEPCTLPITFWCHYDKLLIVLDHQQSDRNLPLPLRVLIAHGEIYKKLIRIICSDGVSIHYKKKRLYWEDEDVRQCMREAEIIRKENTQKIKQIIFDAELADSVLGEAFYDGLDIPYLLAKRLSDYFEVLHLASYYDAYAPCGCEKSEEEMMQWLANEKKRLMVDLKKALPQVELTF